jgi:hypothetical protein
LEQVPEAEFIVLKNQTSNWIPVSICVWNLNQNWNQAFWKKLKKDKKNP